MRSISYAKSRDNFEPEDIKVNESVLEEMVQVREESLFSWQHPLIQLNDILMYLFSIRSWNGDLEHFCSDKIYSTYSSMFCFTETNTSHSPEKHIDEILYDWKAINNITQHGLALCYNVSKVNIIEVIDIPSVLEVLPIVLEIEKQIFLLVIVYHMSGPLGSFIDDFILLINELPRQYSILIVGDFDLDHMLPKYVAKVHP